MNREPALLRPPRICTAWHARAASPADVRLWRRFPGDLDVEAAGA